MTDSEKEVLCTSEDETRNLAVKLAHQLKGGEVIQLIGDLGAGKTAFVKGLAEGLDCTETPTSPTFTVCNRYEGRLTIQHCDFYRLDNDSLIEHELVDMSGEDTVIVLEWAEKLSAVRPDDSVLITITPDAEDNRLFLITIPKQYNYIEL